MAKASKSNLPGAQGASQEWITPLPLRHVAIIMDGNRRWADRKSLPRLFGHREGVQALKRLVRHAGQRQLEYLTVYAFSSENWQRDQDEVDYLLELFNEVLKHELAEIAANNVRLSFIGDLDGMPQELRQALQTAMRNTSANTGLKLQVALNYGSRLELTQAVRAIAQKVASGAMSITDIDEASISAHLYTKDIPDPDLLIRTGGEMRLSNYLLWQCAYTELHITPVMWPEFTVDEFEKAVVDYSMRQRRYGGN